jgi:Cas6b N-terminal domain
MLTLTTIRFPEIHLPVRDAHKLRGYFGEVFRSHSPLLHNHYEDVLHNCCTTTTKTGACAMPAQHNCLG